jgi:hypothetical protein
MLLRFSEFQEILRESLSEPLPNAHPLHMKEKEGIKFFHSNDLKTKIKQKAFKFLRTHPMMSPITQAAVKHHLRSHPDRRPYKG